MAAVFAAKGRPTDHPLIVHLGEAELVEAWADGVPPEARMLADVFWPGPLTMLLWRSPKAGDAVTGAVLQSTTFPGFANVLDLDGDDVVVGTTSPARTTTWDLSTGVKQRVSKRTGYQADLSSDRLAVLTDREREVLLAVGRGLANAEIGRELYLSQATVKTHVSHLFTKLQVTNWVQVAILAHAAGLL